MTLPLGESALEKTVNGLDAERERYIATLAEDLEGLVQQLSNMPEVRQVILFGSYAAGRRDLLTDLDLLVVMDSALDFVARNVELAKRLHVRVALDLLVYTPQEVTQMRGRPFLRHALQTGKILYERRPAG
jgi:predicted nucleotidyltransferase